MSPRWQLRKSMFFVLQKQVFWKFNFWRKKKMKIRRKKRVQRALSFFKNNFGFHPPYRVIVDGTFCQAALKNKVNIEDQIPRYFGSQVRFSTTSCAINETEILGKHILQIDLFTLCNGYVQLRQALHYMEQCWSSKSSQLQAVGMRKILFPLWNVYIVY